MKTMKDGRNEGRGAFTLIEMLIVIVILGILAMVIVPQVSSTSDDAKLSTLRTNLSGMRSAVELYYAQHNSTYPGAVRGGAGSDAEAFTWQMTRYTDATNVVSVTKTANFKYGPYVKGGNLPVNPFNEKANVLVDKTTTDITTRTADGTTGWKFYALTGVLIANDGAHTAE